MVPARCDAGRSLGGAERLDETWANGNLCECLSSISSRGGTALITALVYHRVADFDAWKRSFDEVVTSPLHGAVRSTAVWRSQDDPNLVVLCERYDSREAAEATVTNPAALEAMATAGVDTTTLRIEYFDELA